MTDTVITAPSYRRHIPLSQLESVSASAREHILRSTFIVLLNEFTNLYPDMCHTNRDLKIFDVLEDIFGYPTRDSLIEHLDINIL